MFRYGEISFGDNVRIVSHESTARSGHAGRNGVCYGITRPSATHVAVIGEALADVALNVHFEEGDAPDAWFAPELVAHVDDAVGSRATVGEHAFIKQADGEWVAEGGVGAARPKRRWFRRW